MSNIDSLPDELLQRIFSEVVLGTGAAPQEPRNTGPMPPAQQTGSSSSASAQSLVLSALASIRLSCRRFKLLADTLVWRVLEVPPFSDNLEGRDGTSESRPTTSDWLLAATRTAAGLVKELRFVDPTALPALPLLRPKRGVSATSPLPLLLPNVTTLDLSGLVARSLTDDSFAAVLRFCHSLRRLNLACSTELTDAAITSLVRHQLRQRDAGPSAVMLERINVSRCNRLSFAAIRELVDVMGPNLRCLRSLALPSTGADAVLRTTADKCPNVEDLCLGDTDLGPAGSAWFDLGRNCRKLSFMNITGCQRITSECLADLGRGRLAASQEGWECSDWRYLGLGKLGWSRSAGGDGGGAGALDSESEGEEDDLDLGPVTPVVTLNVVRQLFPANCTQRVDLDMDLSDLVLPVPALSYLAAHDVVHEKLTGLDLSSTTLFVPNVAFGAISSESHLLTLMIRSFTNLKHLSLAQLVPPLTDDLALAVADSCRRLEKLDLRGSFQLSDTGLAALNALPSLVDLDLKACERVTDNGVVGLLHGKAARSLNLGLVGGLSDAALDQIDMSSIVTLKLSGCTMISDQGIRSLVQNTSQDRLNNLNLLCFHNLRLLSPPALENLFKITPNLTSLNLYGCDMVTDQVLTSLGKYCPNLESLCASGCSIGDLGVRGLVMGDSTVATRSGCKRLRTLYLGFLVSSWSSDEISGGCVGCLDETDGAVEPGYVEPDELQGMEVGDGERDEYRWAEDDDEEGHERSSETGSAFGDGDEDEFEAWFQGKMSLDGPAVGGEGTRPPMVRAGSGSSGSETTARNLSSSSTSMPVPLQTRSMTGTSYQSAASFSYASVGSASFGKPKHTGLTDRSVKLLLEEEPYLKILDVSGSDVTLDLDLDALFRRKGKEPPTLEWLKVRCCRRVSSEKLLRFVEGCPELNEVEMVGSGVDAEGRARVGEVLNQRL